MLISALLGAVLVTVPMIAAENDFKAMFVKHWQVAKEFTLAVAEAMPSDSYDFKPSPEELSFGRLMVHIGEENTKSCARATATEPLTVPVATDKQIAIRFLADSFDKCAREVGAMPPEQLNTEVYKFEGQPVLAREAPWYT